MPTLFKVFGLSLFNNRLITIMAGILQLLCQRAKKGCFIVQPQAIGKT
jgi:hypothetical protein